MISDYVAKNKDLQTAEAMRASAQRLFKLREDQSNKDDLATADQEIKGLKIGADSLLKKIADSATAILQESISREVIGSSASWLGSEALARIQKELAEDRTFTTDHVNKVQVVLRDHVDAMELLELRIKEQEDRTRLRETPLAERSKELEKAVDANRGQIQSIQSTLDKQKDFDELLQESESRVVRQLQAQIEDFNAQCEGIEQDMLNKAEKADIEPLQKNLSKLEKAVSTSDATGNRALDQVRTDLKALLNEVAELSGRYEYSLQAERGRREELQLKHDELKKRMEAGETKNEKLASKLMAVSL